MGLPSKQEYHLDCDMCGGTFWSEEGFPAPQYCPACLRSQLKDAEEVMAGQDMLLKAYRTGNHRIADKALDRLSLADYRTKYGEVE